MNASNEIFDKADLCEDNNENINKKRIQRKLFLTLMSFVDL